MPESQNSFNVAWLPEDDADRHPLPTKIAVALIREIIAGRHAPEDWLREQDISDRFEVSRAPVREALRFLEQAGFVELFPWRGAKITAPTASETNHIFDLLGPIYGTVAKTAAEAHETRTIKALDGLHAEARKALTSAVARDDRVRIAHEVALCIARSAQSRVLYRSLIHVGTLAMWQHRHIDPHDLAIARESYNLHGALIDALRRRNARTAELAASAIVEVTRKAVIEGLELQTAAASED